MNYRRYIQYSFILVIVIFLFLALIANSFYFRLDLSSDQSFSISEYSKDVLRMLSDDVELTYYLSPRLQTRVPAVAEISDLLYEYQRISRGSFRVEIIDPDANTGVSPEDLGIAPRELQIVENNEQTFALVYSGMAISYRDSLEVIPLITNAANLEYEITSRLLSLTQNQQLLVAVLLAKENPDFQQYQTMVQYLGQYYEMSFLQAGDDIPPTADGLVVLGMAQLDEGDLYAIEQFLLSGKGVFIAVEAAEVNLQQNLRATDYLDHPMVAMLASYGIQLGNSWIFDEQNLRIPVQQQQGNVLINRYQPYPQWVQVQGSATNGEHPISARFQGLDLFWVSPLTLSESLEDAEVLFSASPNSALVTDFLTDPAAASVAMLQAQDTAGNYALAVSVNDGLKAYFTEPPAQLINIVYADPLVASEESRLLVFGDSDFPSELYQTGGSSYNILFMQTVFEYLVGDEELLDIRTRGSRNRRLDALAETGKNTVLALARVFSFGILPAMIIGFAVFRYNRRRKKAKIPFSPATSKESLASNNED